MTARAEGFWWVRLRGGTVGWEVVRFEYGSLWRMGTAAQIDAEHEVEQWGPYLGKEPGDQNRLPGLSRWGKVSPAGADTLRIADDEGRRPVRTLTTVADVNLEDIATLADHADDCTCDWCRRPSNAEVNAMEERLDLAQQDGSSPLAEETPTP